jgi:hypothetical protein
MKTLIFFALVLTSLLISLSVQAGDRIGNGGSMWACQDDKQQVYDLLFMDTYEARGEWALNLPEIQVPELEAVQQQKAWISSFLKDSEQINRSIVFVENNITWINEVITVIPDSYSRVSPHPSMCPDGKWEIVQLVNFTNDNRILIRKELFDSRYMSNLERAAVYLHEGIYYYLRSKYGDQTSTRARAIVGFLFSDMPNALKVQRINYTLEHVTPKDPNEKPATGFICGLRPTTYRPLYIFEAITSSKATEGAIQACKKGEDPFNGGGFPKGGFSPGGFPPMPSPPGEGFPPGFPDEYGPARECKEERVLCEEIQTAEKKHHCDLKDRFYDKIYRGTGRTRLEAQKEAILQCVGNGGTDSTCFDATQMICN